jgi:hypothetical protein
MSSGSCNLEWLCSFALLGNMNQLTRLDSERWSVNALTVNQNVSVNNQLA